ncbi:MAG: hypothetical protein FGM41_09995 [Bacteroidetes bacterium]|nr:hypothetical protein [Bacteroidota bacterium]
MKPSFVFAVLLFLFLFAGCSQRYFFRPKVRVQTSKFSAQSEVICIKKKSELIVPKITLEEFDYKHDSNLLIVSTGIPFKTITAKLKSGFLKKSHHQRSNNLQDSVKSKGVIVKRVALVAAGTALLFGGLISATLIGYGLALLGLFLIFFTLYQKNRKGTLKSSSNDYIESKEESNDTSPENLRKEEASRRRTTMVLALLIAIGLLLLLFPVLELFVAGFFILSFAPSLWLAANYSRKRTSNKNDISFFVLMEIFGILSTLILVVGFSYSGAILFLLALLLLIIVRLIIGSSK